MAFRAESIHNVFLVRWLSAPALADAQAMVQQVSQAHAALGRPVLFCAVLTAQVGPPEAALRSRMPATAKALQQHCSSIQLVLLGDGVPRTLLRTVMRGALVAARLSGQVFIHDSVEEVLEANRDHLGASPQDVMARARAAGLLG